MLEVMYELPSLPALEGMHSYTARSSSTRIAPILISEQKEQSA